MALERIYDIEHDEFVMVEVGSRRCNLTEVAIEIRAVLLKAGIVCREEGRLQHAAEWSSADGVEVARDHELTRDREGRVTHAHAIRVSALGVETLGDLCSSDPLASVAPNAGGTDE